MSAGKHNRTIQAMVVPPPRRRSVKRRPSQLPTESVPAVPAAVDEEEPTRAMTRRPKLTVVANSVAAPGHTLRVDALDEVEIDLEDSRHGVPRPIRTDRFTQPLSVTRSTRPPWLTYAAGLTMVAAVAVIATLGLG